MSHQVYLPVKHPQVNGPLIFCSAAHNPQPLCPAQHLYLQRNCADSCQSFPTSHTLWTRNHSSLQREAAGRTGASSIRDRRGRVYCHEEGGDGSNYHRFWREVILPCHVFYLTKSLTASQWSRKDRICKEPEHLSVSLRLNILTGEIHHALPGLSQSS